jgi:hypothetical protein
MKAVSKAMNFELDGQGFVCGSCDFPSAQYAELLCDSQSVCLDTGAPSPKGKGNWISYPCVKTMEFCILSWH